MSAAKTIAAAVLSVAALSGQTTRVITTFAGTEWNFSGDGRPAIDVPLSTPVSITIERSGSALIADTNNHVVSRVTREGLIQVVAGNGIRGFSGDGREAVNASLAFPYSAVQDNSGNIYIADFENHVIRRVSPDGVISTFAGRPRTAGFAGDGGPGSQALFRLPAALALDGGGNLFVMDFGNQRVRRITPQGIISTVAGNGQQGFSGDGGPATAASLSMQDNGLVVDGAGNLYISDWANYRIRRVNPQGIIQTFAGNGTQGFSGDGGPAREASISTPTGMAFDSSGNLFFADYLNHRVRRIGTDGVITTVAGSSAFGFRGDGGPATEAQLRFPVGVAVDPSGNLLIVDRFNYRIRRVTTDGTISTYAGNGKYRAIPDGTVAQRAYFDSPKGLAFDSAGNLLVADRNNHYIRRIARDGTVTTIAGIGSQGYSGDGGPATEALISYPTSVTLDRNGNIYFAETFSNRIRRVTPQGIISTVAGTGGQGFNGDNQPATQATLTNPEGILFDAQGNLLITDYFNNRIRLVAPNGVIRTFAGAGTPGFSGDGGPATQAQLNFPRAIALNSRGELLIADTANHRIRLISSSAAISTFAGDGRAASSGDGGPAARASLNAPTGLAFDPAGNLFVIERDGHRIRRIATDGTITTMAGRGVPGYSGDGGPAPQASLNTPDSGIAVDSAGNLLFSDSSNDRLRVVLAQLPALQVVPSSRLTFTASSTGAKSEPQTLRLDSNLPNVPFTAQASASARSWLRVTPEQGGAPSDIRVSVDPGSLTPGNYDGSIAITSPISNTNFTIPVSLQVTASRPAVLGVQKRSVQFSFIRGAASSIQEVVLNNTGDGNARFTAAAATASGGNWMSVTPTSGQVSATSPVTLTVTANPAGLDVGTYTGTVTITSDSGERTAVSVNMTVSAADQQIVLSHTGLTITAVASGGVPLPQSITILNGRGGSLNWSAKAVTLSGAGWLQLPRTSGVTSGVDNISSLNVGVNAAGLEPGEYHGRIEITAPEADNSPQVASVILNVLRPGTRTGPDVRPSSLVFSGTVGSNPGSQTVQMADPSGIATSYASGAVTETGGNWLVYVPSSGTLPADRPAQIVVQPDFAGLPVGVHQGAITIVFNDGSVRNISVVSVVGPAGSQTTSKGDAREVTGCPSRLIPTFSSPSEGFSVTAFQPVDVRLRVVDDCGRPLTTGAVVCQVGTTELYLTHFGNGNWGGSWQPANQGPARMSIIALQGGSQRLGGAAERVGTVRGAATTPFLAAGAVLNGASFVGGAPVAPGAWITFFGQRLSEGRDAASTSPLPLELQRAEVLLGGRPLPIVFASEGQINAQVPYDLKVNTEHQILVRRGSELSLPESLTVAAAQPAIFSKDQSGKGQGVILNATGQLAEPGRPAQPGDIVVIFATGLGVTDPAVVEGHAAPATPLARVARPLQVRIGGMDARVDFAGLSPGFAGVYQINVRVPFGLTASDTVPVTITVSGQTSPQVTMAVR